MLLNAKNYNLLTSHPSNSCVYQDEAKNDIFIKINIFSWVGAPQKTDKAVVHVSLSTFGMLNFISHCILKKGAGCSE